MRNLLCVAASFMAALLALGPPARAQDLIRYLDRKAMKEASASGTIQEENPSTVAYKPLSLAGTKEIPALDISDVVYDVPIAVKLIYRNAQSEESKAPPPAAKDGDRSSAQADALRNYQEVLAKLDPKKYKFAERHIQFKIARLLARLAEESPEQADAAIEGLSSFVKKYPDGWQISQAAKLLARLQMSKGDAEGARKTYETLAATDNIPRQVQQDCEFQIADALISSKKFADAQKKLQGLMRGFSTDGSQTIRVKIYLAKCQGGSGKLQEAVTELEALIAGTSDKDLLSLAYNALGDCYRSNGRNKEALWPYLWVDVIYHHDRDEHRKAMEQLARLFEELGDRTRARQYRERLKRENK